MGETKPILMPYLGEATKLLTEQLKGEVELNIIKFPKELGEDHPFNFETCEKAYSKLGIVKAGVDKHVDFIISPGFYVTSKTKKAEVLINQFIQDTNFHLLLRDWIREALIKGNGFLEIGESKGQIQLKLLNASRMYVQRNKKGEIEMYRQYIGTDSMFDVKKVIEFSPNQIAHLAIDKIGDCAYGHGIIYPALTVLDNLSKSERDLHMLIKRKANSPYVVKLGTPDEPVTQADVDNWGRRLEWQTNAQEYVIDHRTEISVLDFGNISEKFTGVLEYDRDMLFYSFQIPSVLMGTANIPEGLAKVQLDTFERRIQSLQATVEKVVEESILKRVLRINGLDAHVEMEWGQPSEESVNERVNKLTVLLQNPMLSENARRILEIDLLNNLGHEDEAKKFMLEPEDPEELERQKEEEIEQPELPNEKNERFKQQLKEFVPSKEEMTKDYELHEWVGMNFSDYKKAVLEAVKSDEFENLLAETKKDRELGLLTQRQVNELRNILYNGFDKGLSIQMISNDIKSKIRLKDRYAIDSSDNKKYLWFSAAERPIIIARTETIRLANLGVIRDAEEKGIAYKTWILSPSERNCDWCPLLDGLTIPIHDMFQTPVGAPSSFLSEVLGPQLHPMCRCTLGQNPFPAGVLPKAKDLVHQG